MAKKYCVNLTNEERQELYLLIKNRSPKSIQVKRAYILLAADEDGDKQWQDDRIHKTYHVSTRTIERVRKNFVEDGLKLAIYGKPREVFKEKIFDGNVEAHLISLRCTQAPAGHESWTLKLLADKMVELEYVESISCESVRQILKKTSLSPGR
ncbi:MAG: helix-turn-helix domain-containing protein [Desulfamplus sp.]|nr:helix-turn-helix domain-containing protein [Desulfamplus sp.]